MYAYHETLEVLADLHPGGGTDYRVHSEVRKRHPSHRLAWTLAALAQLRCEGRAEVDDIGRWKLTDRGAVYWERHGGA